MTKHFVPMSLIYSYGTRFRENGCFALPKVKGFGKKTFAYRGCTLMNDLPTNIKSISRYQNFKIAVKIHILNLH